MNIQMNPENFSSVHTKAAFLPEGTVQVSKIDKQQPDENTYLKARDIRFHNGVIEVDVCGGLLPDAPDYARGFIGIVFRANENDSEFEYFYIRPTARIRSEKPMAANTFPIPAIPSPISGSSALRNMKAAWTPLR